MRHSMGGGGGSILCPKISAGVASEGSFDFSWNKINIPGEVLPPPRPAPD